MPALRRRRRCRSCRPLIAPGPMVAGVHRTRDPRSAIEERIHANVPEAVTLASWWTCAACADLDLSLRERGLCVGPDVRHAAPAVLIQRHARRAQP